MKLTYTKLQPEAIAPTYGSDGAACFDLYALTDAYLTRGDAATIHTGVAFNIPEGHALMIYSRSGMGFNHGVRLANVVGVCDSDYTGEVMIRLHCDGPSYTVTKGDRVAQAMLVQAPQVDLEEAGALKETKRGAKGFGSTGK